MGDSTLQQVLEGPQGSWSVNLLRELDKERALVNKIVGIEVSAVLCDVVTRVIDQSRTQNLR